MKYILFFLFFPFLLPGQGIIFFEGTWKEALEKAKKEDKLVFVDSYTTWCGPCIKMAKNVFTQESVGSFYNQNFINIKLDMEKEDGVSFGHKYSVKAYPTLHFLDGDGKVVKKIQGGQQAEGLISLGENALKQNDKSGKYADEYEAGNRDYTLVLNYVKALNNAGKPSLKISNDYLNSKPNITEQEKMLFLFEAVVDEDSKLFDRMLVEKETIIPLVGKETFQKKIVKACENTITKAIQFETPELLEEAVKKIKTSSPENAAKFEWGSKYKYYRAFRDEKNFIKSYQALSKLEPENAGTYQSIAKDIIQSFPENQDMLKDACIFAEKAFDIKDDHESLNFLCHIYMVQGDVKTALKHVKNKKEKAVKKGEDPAFYDSLIQYMENKKS
ncbi:MAG: thioredoxin family protein [Saprospiraceae bacterium]|nr:thioredoxin family protein [Saprospiraceae bacterium]